MPCEARPVTQEVRDQVQEAFIAAACLALREFAGTEAVVRAVYWQTLPPTGDDLTAVIRLTCATAGALALSCPRPTAAALAGRILTGVTQEPDEALVRDCLGELANVIAGQAKALLAGMPYHFTYSPPSVVSGAEPGIRPGPESDCLVIAFGSDVGGVVLRLYLNL
jgi:chemotaxis protein CheX